MRTQRRHARTRVGRKCICGVKGHLSGGRAWLSRCGRGGSGEAIPRPRGGPCIFKGYARGRAGYRQCAEGSTNDGQSGARPYPTISDAITAATPGSDRVVIATTGTYATPFTLNKAVEVTNTSGGTVIIDGTGTTYAAQITANGGKITNLTLTGGTSHVIYMPNGGTVKDCTITDGGSAYASALVDMRNGAKLEDCTFDLSDTTSARAIQMTTSSGARVSNCTFNLAKGATGYYVEAIQIWASSDTVEACTFNCDSAGLVIGIDAQATNAVIRNNVINHAHIGIQTADAQRRNTGKCGA